MTSPNTSLVGRVALAIFKASPKGTVTAFKDWETAAIAALKAMREPTEDQLRAAWEKVDFNIDDFWRAMVDAAIQEHTTHEGKRT